MIISSDCEFLLFQHANFNLPSGTRELKLDFRLVKFQLYHDGMHRSFEAYPAAVQVES